MPLYMTCVAGSENQGEPPQAMYDAIDKLTQEGIEQGVLLGYGGLMPTARCARATLKDGEIVITDGPFTESKEVLGGYATYDLPDLETVEAWTKKFLDLHARLWPEFRGTVEIREMFGMEAVKPR
jgi:hypothetical protein